MERNLEGPEGGERRPVLPREAVDPDAELVQRLRRREAGAVDALVATYGDRVYRLAVRITGNASDAEEVAQDALWTVTSKIDTFRGTAAFGSWLYRITARGLPEAAGTAGDAKRAIVGRSRPVLRRKRSSRGAGARLVRERHQSRHPGRAAVRAQRGHR
jgi:hypothetical protein